MNTDCLNQLFSRSSIDSIANTGKCTALDLAINWFCNLPEESTKAEALSHVFTYMKKHYRNEYLFKSVLLKKTVFGKYSPNTASALCELPIENSIADFILINGKAVVYEIKTDLDNLTRINSQIDSYYKAFRYVVILCSNKNAETLSLNFKNTPVGITILTERLTLHCVKEPLCNECNLDPAVQFGILRKKERENILLECGYKLPNVSPVKYYSSCFKLFNEISLSQRIESFEKALKLRRQNLDYDSLRLLPEEFQLIAYNHGIDSTEANALSDYFKLLI